MGPSTKSTKRGASPSEPPAAKRTRRGDGGGPTTSTIRDSHLDTGAGTAKDDSDTISEDSTKDKSVEDKEKDVDSVFTVNTRHYFDQELVDRLTRMNNHSNPASGCYSLGTFPTSAMYWGNGRSDGFRSDQFMFVEGKKALIWALAEVVFPSLVNRDGNAQATPSVKFRPLLQSDFNVLAELIQGSADPPSTEAYDDNGMWASKFVADKSTVPSQIQRFANFYNALTTYKDKKSMPKLDAGELKTGDIVLTEFYVKRYMPKIPKDVHAEPASSPSTPTKSTSSASTAGNDSPTTSSPVSPARVNRYYAARSWVGWDIGLTLESVSLLFKGSDFYQDPEPASEDVSF